VGLDRQIIGTADRGRFTAGRMWVEPGGAHDVNKKCTADLSQQTVLRIFIHQTQNRWTKAAVQNEVTHSLASLPR